MKTLRSTRRRTLSHEAGKPGVARSARATGAPGRKVVSAAEVMAPWQQYGRRLAAKGARRLRDHAPNFLVVAPPKTATTWLYEVLSTDRRVFMPEKECRYFSHFWREYPLASYYAQFQNPFGAVRRGEASPSYFILPSSVIATIRDELPDAKLIVLLRDPGERLWSHVRHSFMYKEGWFRSSTAWRIEEVSEAEWCQALLHPVIRAFDDYAGALARWAEHFAPEQILILSSEMIGAEPEQAALEIYSFLELEKPAADSPFLRNRPNQSPRVALPGSVAELLAAVAAANRGRLHAALPAFAARLADQLRTAMTYWRDAAPPSIVAAAIPKPSGMPPQPNWDQLTTATFPRDLLTWSYNAIEQPANPELLHRASLNFEYSYFSAPPENGMPDEALRPRIQALGTSIIQHDARLRDVERSAAGIHERLSGLERTVEERTERLGNLEEVVGERADRLLALETRAEEQRLRSSGLEAPNAVRDQRLTQLERTIEERSARLSAIERNLEQYPERISALEESDATRDDRIARLEQTIEERRAQLDAIEAGFEEHTARVGSIEASDTVRDQRLGSLEQTIEEGAGRLVGIETRVAQQEQRAAAVEAANSTRDERLSSLQRAVDERTGRLDAVEDGLTELHDRVALREAEMREAISRHSDRVAALEIAAIETRAKLASIAVFETQLRGQTERIAGMERAVAERDTENAERNRSVLELRSALTAMAADLAAVQADQRRLDAVGSEIAGLRGTVEKALYAIALLQESLQGVEDDLNALRLSRIETEYSPVSESGNEKLSPSGVV